MVTNVAKAIKREVALVVEQLVKYSKNKNLTLLGVYIVGSRGASQLGGIF